MGLIAMPIPLAEANEIYASHHRHSKPVRFHLFSIGALLDFRIVGACSVMRPACQHTVGGEWVCEVSRLCVIGQHRNVSSFLLSRASKAAFAMGYLSIQTYTLTTESGSSLRGAGWGAVAKVPGRSWDRAGREKPSGVTPRPRIRWQKQNPEMVKYYSTMGVG